ncbi:zinc-dependent alcohol dehydrogenase family protein [Novosphingobium sp. G106]|uniref:zinc-dependent alcohol dehydrogenase family protein n=1 Tax=Novosphingobium sp. G106 TaxID=2849500 RepID=UPI001C2D917B|nr:zinc-dependent alcohol dehydrogenase family protein [Novosphingobium sp. G106]MBV1691927.1 zinc-dependent alcohol dehydrogenase family protein [Novosphingobium sp. G106]
MEQMLAMQIDAPGRDLRAVTRPVPCPRDGEVLVRVSACGVCRTDLHVFDGEVRARYPIIPGHEIVGHVAAVGGDVEGFETGQRVGIPWLGHTCGRCLYCRSARENLCDNAEFTGATRDGGYATHVLADPRYCFSIPDRLSDVEAAPLLCAGLIGWRALRLAGKGKRLGFFGFGAAAHILTQVARWQNRQVYAFTRAGDAAGQSFALSLGCAWAGSSNEKAPAELDAAIIFAPVGDLVPIALRSVAKGGRVVCAGIHMSDIPAFAYSDLWEERQILSVANLTREDGLSFFEAVEKTNIRTVTTPYPLREANRALADLRAGGITGAAVLVM